MIYQIYVVVETPYGERHADTMTVKTSSYEKAVKRITQTMQEVFGLTAKIVYHEMRGLFSELSNATSFVLACAAKRNSLANGGKVYPTINKN